MLQIPDEPLEIAFARNVAWLAQFGQKLPRHMVQIGWYVQRHPFSLVQAEIARWIAAGDMIEDKAGDFRLTKAGEARIALSCLSVPPRETPNECASKRARSPLPVAVDHTPCEFDESIRVKLDVD